MVPDTFFSSDTNASTGPPSDVAPTRRVVLIGASNLAIGLPAVVDAAREAWGGPLDVLAALGHGRSYVKTSRVLWRTLPSIAGCRLWEELAQRYPVTTAALVTDIGNDILYGIPIDTILAGVEACVQRLSDVSESLVITAPPMESLECVGAHRFLLMRTLLFPTCRLELRRALHAARALNEGVAALADRHGAQLVAPRPVWYGFDPIHVRRAQRARAWREVFSHWRPSSLDKSASRTTPRSSLRERLTLRTSKPYERGVFGKSQYHRQPAAVLADGTTLSLY